MSAVVWSFEVLSVDSRNWAGGALLFDQVKPDHLRGHHARGPRDSAQGRLWVWDRPGDPFPVTGEACRAFLGKTKERAAVVELRDGAGRVRLRLEVPAEGAPRVELPDEEVNVTGGL